jgi:ribosomal protein S25
LTEDDFDPAKAIREARQQWEVEATQEQCAQAQQQTLDDKITEAVRGVLSETRVITPLTCGDAGSEPSFR